MSDFKYALYIGILFSLGILFTLLSPWILKSAMTMQCPDPILGSQVATATGAPNIQQACYTAKGFMYVLSISGFIFLGIGISQIIEAIKMGEKFNLKYLFPSFSHQFKGLEAIS
jgi:hypothetical protein